MRTIYLYQKYDEDDAELLTVLQSIREPEDQVMSAVEHPFRFSELDKAIENHGDTIIIAHDLCDLGMDKEDTSARLSRIIRHHVILLLASVPATYEHGITASANGIVLDTLRQVVAQGHAEIANFRKRSVGRPKLDFPVGWDEKYADWQAGRISSKEFLDWSGMKKATFYHRVTDYKRILEEEDEKAAR